MPGGGRTDFRILEDIARDLSGDVNFPTCLDAAVLVRDTLKDPFVSGEQVVQAISVEPLLCSKLLRLANSVTYNQSGKHISSLNIVVQRLGIEIVRTTSLAVAIDQMLKSKNLTTYAPFARASWECSLQVAAIARVLARHFACVEADTAMLAGLVHNIGGFFLLFRAAEYPEYRNNETAMIELVGSWYPPIGESLLHHLGLPAAITDAVRDQGQHSPSQMPHTVSDVLCTALSLADIPLLWLNKKNPADEMDRRFAERARYADLLKAAEAEIIELRSALSA